MTKKKNKKSPKLESTTINPITRDLKEALSTAAKEKGTNQVCSYMHAITNASFPLSKWANYTKRERDQMIRADWIPAAIESTGSLEPIKVLVNHIPGVELVTTAQYLKLRKLEIAEEIEVLKRQEEKLGKQIEAIKDGEHHAKKYK